jgi:hypothetical protein
LRSNSLSLFLTSSAKAEEEKKQENYRLYLLPDNSPKSLAIAMTMINDGNAVLLFPDPKKPRTYPFGPRGYKACFIQKGKLFKKSFESEEKVASSNIDKIVEVTIGKHKISTKMKPPCDITFSIPQATNFSNAALAKAGIQIAPILQMPHAVFHTHLAPCLETVSLNHLIRGSLYAQKLTQSELDQRALKKLFLYILDGNAAAVKQILKINPRLAVVKFESANTAERIIANKAGQLIKIQGKTAYQLALGEKDTELAGILKAYIVKVKDENEASAQFYAQFPGGSQKEIEEKRWAPIFTQLNQLSLAIKDAEVGDIISSAHPEYKLIVKSESRIDIALNQFRFLIDAALKEAVTSGEHFNSDLLLHAFKIYYDHFKDFFGNNKSSPQALLFWQQVIGFIQRIMPANYVQAFCNGLYDTYEKLQKNSPQGRLLEYNIDYLNDEGHICRKSNPFYPLSVSELGFSFAIYASMAEHHYPARTDKDTSNFSGYWYLVSVKNEKLAELAPHHDFKQESQGNSYRK